MGGNKNQFPKHYVNIRKKFNNNIIINFFLFFYVYIYNWFKILKGFFYKLLFFNVCLDRYPSYEFFFNNKRSQILNTIFYFYFFYNPKNIVFLYEKPEVILSRKNEATAEKINLTLEIYTRKLRNNKHALIIKNTDINETLGKIIKKYDLHK